MLNHCRGLVAGGAIFFLIVSTGVLCASSTDELLDSATQALQDGNKDQALQLADKAVAADPKNAAVYVARASIRDARGEFDRAVADYDQLIELVPNSAVVYQRRGEDEFRLGHFKESVADFDKVIELNPSRAPYHWQRGISLYCAGEFDKGAKQFELHKTVNPEDVENAAWHFLCIARLSGVDKARDALIPIHADGRVPMMQVYALFAGKGTAQDVMVAVNAGQPDEAELKDRLFYSHLYLGLFDEASGHLQSAREHIRLAAGKLAGGDYMGDVARVHERVLDGNISLVAGGGTGASGIPATQAKLDKPFAVAFDKAGNMYIGEYGGQRVLKVDPAGVLTILAGTGEKGLAGDTGPATAGKFNCIHDLVVGPDGSLYIADSFNLRVRKIDLKTGILTTFAGTGVGKIATGDDGPADKAALDGVASLYFDSTGKTLYLAGFSKSIRAIDMKTQTITTLKDVPGGRSIAVDSKDNLYIAAGQTLTVRPPDGKLKVLLDKTHTGGEALPLAANPKHLGIDAHDNVWICDEEHCLIREFFPATGKLVTIIGNGKAGAAGLDGPPSDAQVNRPHGIYFHAATGAMYIADSWNDRVLKFEP